MKLNLKRLVLLVLGIASSTVNAQSGLDGKVYSQPMQARDNSAGQLYKKPVDTSRSVKVIPNAMGSSGSGAVKVQCGVVGSDKIGLNKQGQTVSIRTKTNCKAAGAGKSIRRNDHNEVVGPNRSGRSAMPKSKQPQIQKKPLPIPTPVESSQSLSG